MTIRRWLAMIVAVVLVVAVAPVSSWIFRNQVRLAAGDLIGEPTVPLTTGLADEDAMVRAIDDKHTLAYAESRPNDPVAWAVAARYGVQGVRPLPPAQSGGRTPIEQKRDQQREADRRRAFGEVRTICAHGEQIDPENGFFPMVLAAVEMMSGRTGEAKVAYERVARAARYESYWMREAQARAARREKSLGYDGEMGRAMPYFAVLFPELSVIGGASKEVRKSTDDALRVAAVRAGTTMMRHADTLIGILVGAQVVTQSVLESSMSEKDATAASQLRAADQSTRDAETLLSARKLDQRMPGASAERAVQAVQQARKVRLEEVVGINWPYRTQVGVSVGAGILACLMLMVVAGIVLTSRWGSSALSDASRAALRHLYTALLWLFLAVGLVANEQAAILWFISIGHVILALTYSDRRPVRLLALLVTAILFALSLIAVVQAFALDALLIGSLGLFYVLWVEHQTVERRMRSGFLAGLGVSAAAIVASSGAPEGWLPLLIFALSGPALKAGDGWYVKGWRWLWLFLWTLVLGGALALDTSREAMGLRAESTGNHVWIVLLVIAGALLQAHAWRSIAPERRMRPWSAMAVVFLLAYVGSVGWSLRSNADDRAMFQAELESANRMRERITDL